MIRSIATIAVLVVAAGVGSVAQASGTGPHCLPPAVSHAVMTAARGHQVQLPANWAQQRLQIGHCTIRVGQFTAVMATQMGSSQYQTLGRLIDR
jgi:hypothetical protein